MADDHWDAAHKHAAVPLVVDESASEALVQPARWIVRIPSYDTDAMPPAGETLCDTDRDLGGLGGEVLADDRDPHVALHWWEHEGGGIGRLLAGAWSWCGRGGTPREGGRAAR